MYVAKNKVWKLWDGTMKKLFQKGIVLKDEETNRSADEVWHVDEVAARDSLLKAKERTCGRVRGPPRHTETW